MEGDELGPRLKAILNAFDEQNADVWRYWPARENLIQAE
jgi:hypothetical protein